MIHEFKQRIKRRETALDDFLYRAFKSVRRISVPMIPALHSALFHERMFRVTAWRRFKKIVYYEPLFKSQCTSVGRGFRIEDAGGDGIPAISGGLKVHIGDNVCMMDKIAIIGVSVGAPGKLTIGDDTYIGPDMLISVAREISIGRHCLIGAHMLTDNPGHPLGDLRRRITGSPLLASEVRPIAIGDFVWIATGVYVYPGCRIGDGVMALPGTIIRGMDVPPFTVVGGNPGRVEAKLPLPKSLIEIVGDERYEQYRAIHRDLKIR